MSKIVIFWLRKVAKEIVKQNDKSKHKKDKKDNSSKLMEEDEEDGEKSDDSSSKIMIEEENEKIDEMTDSSQTEPSEHEIALKDTVKTTKSRNDRLQAATLILHKPSMS